MGTKQLIILFIGALVVTGCTSEITTYRYNSSQEKVPVSIQFIPGATPLTKAPGWEYDDFFPETLEKEKIVSDILLVVFKDNLLEEYTFFKKANNDFTQEPDYSIQLGNEQEGQNVIDLDPGPHYFYALLNLPDKLHTEVMTMLEGKENTLSKDDFEKKLLEGDIDYLTGNKESFLMTNITPPEIRPIYSEEQIKNNTGLNNNVIIRVGRAVGKISFAYVASEVQTGELHGRLENIHYKILNNPASMYLMPVIEEKKLITPHYTYYPKGYFTPSVKDANILDGEWLNATTQEMVDLPVNKNEFDYGYGIENNNKFPLKSNSTMLLIKAKFIPAVWLNPDGTEGSPNPDGTFYRIGQYNDNGVLYTYLQGYYNDEPVLPDRHASGPFDSIEYEEGITYYGCWLINDDQFQIKRNSYYKVAITHIHGAGEPDPGKVTEPDTDPDEVDTWGRIAVSVTNWNEENQLITIGKDPQDSSGVGTNPDVKEWEDEDDQEEELGSNNEFN